MQASFASGNSLHDNDAMFLVGHCIEKQIASYKNFFHRQDCVLVGQLCMQKFAITLNNCLDILQILEAGQSIANHSRGFEMSVAALYLGPLALDELTILDFVV